MGVPSLDRVNVYVGAGEMIDMGGNKKTDDHPVAEAAWPPARVAGAVRRREKKEKTGRAGVLLLVCVIGLPFLLLFLVVFFGGRGGAPAAWQNATKLAAICGGTLLTDPSFEISSNTVQLAHVCTAIAIRAQNSVQYFVFQKNLKRSIPY
jgi:hypothetical protein